MPETLYRNRRACRIENDCLRLTVTVEGGHVAEILHKATGVNPLWTPPWPSIEPSTYDLARHPEYGSDSESKLLAGIMGHNLCLDLFGGPSDEEAAAGMTVHGEGSIAPYEIDSSGAALTMRANLPAAQLHFEREIRLDGEKVLFRETIENLSILDRPVAWTQHVTLGPPFLEKGATLFRATATRSRTAEGDWGEGAYMRSGVDFDWPNVPLEAGGTEDLRRYTSRPSSGGFTTHVMDPASETASFFAWSPSSRLRFGYVWKRTDFPWLSIWEENNSRSSPPWNARTLTRGMEFGASPMPESRRAMIDRNNLFGIPTYRWIPAKKKVTVEYWAVAETRKAIED